MIRLDKFIRCHWFRFSSLVLAILVMGCHGRGAFFTWNSLAQEIQSLDAFTLDLSTPDSVRARAHFMTGRIRELSGKSEEALKEYLEAVRLEPGNNQLVIKVVRSLIAEGNWNQCIDLLEKSIKNATPNAEIYAWLGLSYSNIGKIKPAQEMSNLALTMDPSILISYQTIADIQIRLGQTAEAQSTMDLAIAQEFKEYNKLLALIEFIENVSQSEAWSPQWTQPRMTQLLKELEFYIPENSILLIEIADRYWELGQPEKALPFYYRAIDQYPSLGVRRKKMTAYFMENQRWDEAMEMLDREEQIEPLNPLWPVTRAEIYIQQEKFDLAEAQLLNALVVDPLAETVYIQLAQLQFNQGKLDQGLDSIRAADEKFGADFDRSILAAYIESNAGRGTEAVKYFETAEQLATQESRGPLNHVFYYQMAMVYEKAQDYVKAETALLKSLELKNNFAEAMNFLGYMLADRNIRLPEARVWIEKALAAEPDNPAFQDSMAWVFYRLGDYKSALNWILKCQKGISQPDPVIFDHLGDIRWKLGQKEQAIEAWNEAIKLDPENKKIRAKIDGPGL
jgi:tetratricopeptide (TPR) repeat protein